jgi:hypothetical protein
MYRVSVAHSRLRERLLATFAPDDEKLPRRKRRKPWGTWRTAASAFGGYVVVTCWLALGIALALLVATAATGWSALVISTFTLAAVIPLMVVGSWLAGRRAALRVLLLGIAPLLAIGICGGVAAPEWILLARGHSVTAVVTGADRRTNGRGVVSYDYTLRSLDGGVIAGRLETGDSAPRPIGSRVEVVEDPAGLAAPDLADAVATQAEVSTVVAATGLVLLAVIVGSFAAYGERQRRRWHHGK